MTEQQTKARRGCFFYGCILAVAFFLLILVGGFIGLRYAKKMVNSFLDTSPTPLPTVNMTPAEMEQVHQRVDAFRNAIRSAQPTPPLSLTADEVNALIATDPDLKPLNGKIFVTIPGDQVRAQMSVSMEEAGLPVFKGRYLNGIATLNVSLGNGTLHIHAQDITVKGKPLPDVYMQKIRAQNLARDINNNPRASVGLNKLKSIEVKDGKVVIIPLEEK